MEYGNAKKPSTIREIAKAANVSTATVSRVLSGSGYPVSNPVRKKVLETAEKLDYSPNLLGRMLKQNKALDIGVIVPTIQNPFYTEVLIGIEAVTKKKGYDILLYNSYRDVENERRYIKKLLQRQVRSLIISTVDDNIESMLEFINNGGHVALIDQDVEFINFMKVGFDFVKAGRMAVNYLISMGHTSIAFLSPPLRVKSRVGILKGYKQALSEHNIPIRDENIIITKKEHDMENGLYEFENGKEMARVIASLKNRPTAIFTVNDITAFGVIQQLTAYGIMVPDDVSVIGFDNIETSKMINPPLTTVDQYAYETGKAVGRMIIDAPDNSCGENVFRIEPRIVTRKSVKRMRLPSSL